MTDAAAARRARLDRAERRKNADVLADPAEATAERARVRRILAEEVDEAARLHDAQIDVLRDAAKDGDLALVRVVSDGLRTIETRLSVACRLYEAVTGEIASAPEIAEALR